MRLFTSALFLILFTGLVSPVWGQYVVDFEGEGETKTSYASGTVNLSGLDWNLTDALVGTAGGDIKNGLRAARLRHGGLESGVGASMTMLEDKTNGIGTISLLYARSDFSGDRTITSPTFVVKYSTDAGENWTQTGNAVNLAGVDELSEFLTVVNVEGNARIRIRSISGDDGKRFNIDDIMITDFVAPEVPSISVSPIFLAGFEYVEGEGPSDSELFTVNGSNLDPEDGNLTVTGSDNFEVSLDNTTFSGFVNINYRKEWLQAAYIYRFQAGDFTQVKKMLFLK